MTHFRPRLIVSIHHQGSAHPRTLPMTIEDVFKTTRRAGLLPSLSLQMQPCIRPEDRMVPRTTDMILCEW